jgi:adenylate kinase
MSSVIDMNQYDMLAGLRRNVAAAISTNNAVDMHRTIGIVQGYLIGLHIAGEIDAHDVESLEKETLANVDFLLNARKAAKRKASDGH